MLILFLKKLFKISGFSFIFAKGTKSIPRWSELKVSWTLEDGCFFCDMHSLKWICIWNYSDPYFSRIRPHSDWIQRDAEYLSVFSPNAGKCGKNVGQNNSEYGHLLRSNASFEVNLITKFTLGDWFFLWWHIVNTCIYF